jgi:hypothetical protein
MNTHHIAYFGLIIATLSPTAAQAEGEPDTPMHWALEVKGGLFYPEEENWDDYYDNNRMPQYLALTLAYKVMRQLELGLGAWHARDSGKGSAPNHPNSPITGEVDYSLYPLEVFAAYRAVYSESQTLVPYVAAGYTRVYYQQEIAGQSDIKGAVNGHHFRGGLQLLLDEMDPIAAADFQTNYGVENTYLLLEAEQTNAEINGAEVGGRTYSLGMTFEF